MEVELLCVDGLGEPPKGARVLCEDDLVDDRRR